MKFNLRKENQEDITMEAFKETMETVKTDLDMYFNHLDECINEYIKSNAVIAADKEVNHLTFYTFTYAYLNYIYSLLKISYKSLEAGREAFAKAAEKFGITTETMVFAYQYCNAATIKYNAFDDICKLFEKAFNDADEYLKHGCKCGMNFQKEKLPKTLPVLVIDSIEKMISVK